MSRARNIAREIGTAFAVLAIYLLTILAPLHHARASQLALQDLGYAIVESGWVLCTAQGAVGDERDVLVAKCPATAISKLDLAPAAFGVMPVLRHTALAAPLSATAPAFQPRPAAPSGGPRGPPVSV